MKRILVVLDLTDMSNSLIRFAFPFSKKHKIDHIDFIYVKEEVPENEVEIPVKGYTGHFTPDSWKADFRKISSMIDNSIKREWIRDTSYNVITETGDPAEKIADRASEIHYELIMAGQHHINPLERFFRKNTCAEVLEKVGTHVLVFEARKKKWLI